MNVDGRSREALHEEYVLHRNYSNVLNATWL